MAKIEPLYQIRHSCTQFIRGKPIRFAYKIWMLASNTGLPYRVAIYQGKENSGDSDKPLGYRVVTSSHSPCANPSDHHIFLRQLLLVVPARENSF